MTRRAFLAAIPLLARRKEREVSIRKQVDSRFMVYSLDHGAWWAVTHDTIGKALDAAYRWMISDTA